LRIANNSRPKASIGESLLKGSLAEIILDYSTPKLVVSIKFSTDLSLRTLLDYWAIGTGKVFITSFVGLPDKILFKSDWDVGSEE
jgi:hypothetical protein